MQICENVEGFTAMQGQFQWRLVFVKRNVWSPSAPVCSTVTTLSHLDTFRQGYAADLQLAPAGGQSGLDSLARKTPDWFNFHMTDRPSLISGHPIIQPVTTTRPPGESDSSRVSLSGEEHTNPKWAKPAAFLWLEENILTYEKLISTQYSYSTEWGQEPPCLLKRLSRKHGRFAVMHVMR